MKKTLFLICFACTFFTMFSQTFEWARQMGGGGIDVGYSVAVDRRTGDVYTTGFFKDTVDFDPGAGTLNLISKGDYDAFISKLDAWGNMVWTIQLGYDWPDYGLAMAVDDAGFLYVTGKFQGTVDFDPGSAAYNLTSAGGYDVFIAKLDMGGNFVWVRQIGGNYDDTGVSIAVDASGNVHTLGVYGGTVDFDPGSGVFNHTSSGNALNPFISKLDANGNFVWANVFASSSFGESRCLVLDDAGNVYTTGNFNGTMDFDPSGTAFDLVSYGSTDVYVSKLDAAGNFVWARQLGGLANDQSYSIAVDALGNVYTAGYFAQSADLDPGPGTLSFVAAGGSFDVFISKLDATGNLVWARQMGGGYVDYVRSIVVDAVRNVYTLGRFKGTVDFDPDTSSSYNLASYGGSNDIFISKLDEAGDFAWAKQIGGEGSDEDGACLVLDGVGNLYATGDFSDTADLDPDASTLYFGAVGAFDVFVLKMNLCQGVNVDVTVTNDSPILMANAIGATYQWIYCDSVAVAGETHSSFTATMNGNYAVLVAQGGCADTSECYQVTNVGIEAMAKRAEFVIAPNPTDGRVKVNWHGNYAEVGIKVYNAIGQGISCTTASFSDHASLDIPGGAGIYFLEIQAHRQKPVWVKVVKD